MSRRERYRTRYRHLRRTLIAVLATLALVLVAGLGLVTLLHSRPVLEWTRHLIERRLATELGAEVEIGGLGWTLAPPAARLDHVVVRLAHLELELDQASVSVDRLGLLDRTLELGTVTVRGARLAVRKLPARPPTTHGSWLRVRVHQLDLADLHLEGRNLPASIEHIVLGSTDLAWVAEDGELRGLVQVGELRLDVRGLETVRAAIGARFISSGGHLQVPFWRAAGPELAITGSGWLEPDGRWHAEARGDLALAELDRVVRAGGVLEGPSTLHLTAGSEVPGLAQAEIRSPRIDVEGFELGDVEGTLALSGPGLRGQLRQARFHGGWLSGTYGLSDLGPVFAHTVHLDGHGVGLAPLLTNLGVPPAGLAAQTDLAIDLAWNGKQIAAGAGLGRAEMVPPTGPATLPVEGVLEARLEHDGLLHFDARALRIGGSTFQWQGPLTLGTWVPAWSIHAAPAVLSELVPMINTWIGEEAVPAALDGQGELQVSLAGPWRQLRVDLRLEASPLRYPPLDVDRALIEGHIADGRLELGPARFRLGEGTGEIEGTIAWKDLDDERKDVSEPDAAAASDRDGTRRVSERSPPEVDADADAAPAGGGSDTRCNLSIRGQDLPLGRLASWIGLDPEDARGTASFTGSLRGTLGAPRGSWALALQQVELLDQDLGDGHATVELGAGTVNVRGLSFSGGLEGSVVWSPGTDELQVLTTWPGMPLAAYGGTAVDMIGPSADLVAQLRWPPSAQVEGLLTLTSPTARITIDASAEAIEVEAGLAGAASVRAELERDRDGGLHGSGRVELEGADVLLARLLPGRGVPLAGTGGADLELDWPADAAPRLTGRVTALDLRLGEGPVRLLQPAGFELGEQGLRVDGLELELLDDEVFVRWTIDPEHRLSGNLSGTLDALLLRLLVPGWEPAGQVTGVVELLGTLEAPQLEGIAELTDASFRLPGTRDVVSDINGTVLLSSDEARLDGLGFRLLHGSGRASGTIRMHDGEPELALAGSVSDIEYGLFPGLSPRLRGSWRLEGLPDTLRLSGDLEVDRAMLRRKDDLVAILIDWFGSDTAPATGSGIALDLHVEADHTLEARSPFFSLSGSASLDVIGTSTEPGLLGTIELHEGGDVTFQGVRYEIERGTLTFSDPVEINPFVELQAQAWVQSYRITVQLTGTPDHLVPVLTSDPPLTEAEIISVLALGYRNEELASHGVASMGLASTLLTRDINAELERRARLLLPVDQVRVDPFAEYSTGNPAARVTVVKQLSPSWTVIVQSNLSSNREEVVVSRWFLGPGLFLEATRDVDGSYAMDIKLRRSY